MNINLAPKVQKEKKVFLQSNYLTHLAFLDGLRGVAALYVVLHHVFLQIAESFSQVIAEGSEFESIPVRIIAFLLKHGRLAVDLFIVISGFCLMMPVVQNKGVLKAGAFAFFIKRAKRILPPYYLAMGLSLLLIFTVIGEKTGTHWDFSLPVTKTSILTHLFLIQDILSFTAAKINHAFWSISVEWRIYLLFPVIVYFWKSQGPFFTSLIAIVFSGLLYLAIMYLEFFVDFELAPSYISPHYLGLFILGALAAELTFTEKTKLISIRERLPLKFILLILALAIFLLLKDNLFYTNEIVMLLGDLFMGTFSACLLIGVAVGKFNAIHQVLSWKPLVFIGTFAYSLYLVHAPFLQIISQYVVAPLALPALISIILFFLIGVPCILAISYLFFLVAERPFMKKR